MKVKIINGPNLNLLGKREVEIYGNQSFEDYLVELKGKYANQEISYFQSNSEGDLVDKIQACGFDYDGIILNAGAYSHTSVALGDAIAAIETPVVSVHISNVHAREGFRKEDRIGAYCKGVITGLGLKSYELALEYFMDFQ